MSVDQKLENLLNLALDTNAEERSRSSELETGFNPEENTWELIVKYSGNLDEVRSLGAIVEEMRNEYAILTVKESQIPLISALPQIEYIEKPKRLFFAINQAKAASCVNILQEAPPNLSGRGVLIAVLDSGIDYFHEAFRKEDGSTRILELWDQIQNRIYTSEEINKALESGNRAAARQIVPSVDVSGHGTAVAGIAAGLDGAYRGIAYESDLLVVKLGTARPGGFPRTTELMRAVNYAVSFAADRFLSLVINISFGNTYGSHDGTSLLETFLDDIGNYGRTTIVVGSGNEGAASGHTSGILQLRTTETVEFTVSSYESSFSIQLWKSYSDQFEISLQAPSGEQFGPFSENLGPARFRYRRTQILLYYGKPGPFSTEQEIYFDFIPDEGTYVEEGIWTFFLRPVSLVSRRYDFWLPSAGGLNTATRFLRPTPDTTLTIPSTASKVITVGAYNSYYNSYADFSGRGFTRLTNQVKPDLAAPGVGIMAPAVNGGYQSVTGTSFATPVVAGSAALLMQWGIVNGNDLFLYGEKVKAYLRRGAGKLPGITEYPNPMVGYGRLCVEQSLPKM
ncbi:MULTISPECIES: S8 family peptidase [unclassified Clostridium]|uniref:S8 family peptidase n=1 Tax=unclassified Clostridium TaxID=2614128 RepID=UPI000E48DB6B|nr:MULTISPECIES: S8 family peptidase [unclassified Clostridium]RHP44041.1 peptidase S8 [Clostridium sp. AF32-12BH]RHV66513.1 peptidase S8 [Clostridium sp. OM02-18AC]